MRTSTFRPPLPFLLALCCLALGCSPPPRTVEVVGRVTLNGRPVAGALVVFVSKHRDDAPAHGTTDADGRYYLTSVFASHDMPRGAVPDRDYAVYIEKYRRLDSRNVLRKVMAIRAAGGDIWPYVREQAVYDLWPDGVPEDWPMGYIPCLSDVPREIKQDQEAWKRVGILQVGMPLLPLKYGDAATSGFSATVERRDEPQVFDFNMTGEVNDFKLRKPRAWKKKDAPTHQVDEPTAANSQAEATALDRRLSGPE